MSSLTDEVADPAGAMVAEKLHAFEQMLCETLALGNELSNAALQARRSHRISPTVGHPFFVEIDQATSAVVVALGHVARGHRVVTEVGKRFGLPVAYGDTGKDESDKPKGFSPVE